MSKKVKIIIVIILVVIVCIICFFSLRNSIKTEEVNNDIQNIITENKVSENILEENMIETENTIDEENKMVEDIGNEMQNNNLEETHSEVVPSSSVYESNSDLGTTNKKQEAIELVKEKWGEDSSVDFRCDSVTTNGEYIIAVLSIETATVRNYFRVNLENKTVEIDY